MKKILLPLLVGFLLSQLLACQNIHINTPPQATGNSTKKWVLIHQEEKANVYIQPESIQVHPQNAHWRSCTLLLDIPAANRPFSVAQYTFDCKNQTYRIESISFYSEPYGQGEVQYTIGTERNLFLPISPQSYIKSGAFPIVCHTY